jgi:hypothetical protein
VVTYTLFKLWQVSARTSLKKECDHVIISEGWESENEIEKESERESESESESESDSERESKSDSNSAPQGLGDSDACKNSLKESVNPHDQALDSHPVCGEALE